MLVPLLTFVIMMAVLMAVYIGIISLRVKSTFLTLWHKIKPSFIVAMKNASVGAAYGANESCCVRKLGIPTPTVMYVLPRGLAIYMPASIFEMAFFALYLVSADEMQITLSWLLKALIMTVAVVVATPPVTGIGVFNFLCLLTALNISQEALIAFLVVDTVLGFVIYPVNQALLQLHLIRVAIRRGELQTEIIQR
ncbi:MAG: cation:dicarboxylase symporter family transporter, partial [Oscillospiraceae bacterium]|nr:cation:dicarboxylase symporter family transporter [Oscillospiraceae bacterium]